MQLTLSSLQFWPVQLPQQELALVQFSPGRQLLLHDPLSAQESFPGQTAFPSREEMLKPPYARPVPAKSRIKIAIALDFILTIFL